MIKSATAVTLDIIPTLRTGQVAANAQLVTLHFCGVCFADQSFYPTIQLLDSGNNNVISNAPHTLKELIADNWNYPYSKEKASFPYKTPTTIKFWSSVSRINNAYGDRNLICSCNVNQIETLEEKKCA